MKKLIVDMDDVLCEKGFINMVNEFLGTNYEQEDANSYYINDLVPDEKLEEWVKFFEERNVYEYEDLAKDVQDVMEKLNNKYELYIVTAFIYRDAPEYSGKLLKNKFEYLYKNFPFIKPEQYIFASNKDLIEADIRIDDSVLKLNGKAEIKLLYTSYYNKEISDEELENNGIKRVNSWREIEKILL